MEQHQKQGRRQLTEPQGHLLDIPINNIGLRDVLALVYLVKGPAGTLTNPGTAYDWADRLLYYREEG
tara:strand:+ start:856 stop:1056 length:201 start_codon:yes stop_codon:yes gene_type:complete